MIQGPPGTGKTTVIAAFVNSILEGSDRTVWLTAQSNVAVKNIAMKLADCNIWSWKLVVSSDFHLGWHEHLYGYNIQSHVIVTSGKLSSKLFQGCRIILCTISMLSSRLGKFGLDGTVPLQTLVVDEASQIEIGQYLPVLSRFVNVLRKICFIGDDKQYRMPPPIGDFISEHMYTSNLKSNPEHPIKNINSCQFFDITYGQEERVDKSWKNMAEVIAIMKMSELLSEKDKEFKIITPYDAQRTLIEKTLRDNELEWKDKCFNVDSFQGNEEEIIIISLVRSRDIGFLKDMRRTNVMLSRCKQQMYILSSKVFLQHFAAKTLVGKMAKHWEEAGEKWITLDQLVEGKFNF
ncbi:hypothetical protein BD410DRAFT_813484 [Rickenella mellea]|uniref:P-loop containing nucleoside triphosphate hydrolase protein n=1 Tax=Rickenella mellea TaxID=50990 RepID=A0A4Y7QDT9_9AGAM|nr:hypothetical protein BD410DRAFT_813484 [Rickenella mellea]